MQNAQNQQQLEGPWQKMTVAITTRLSNLALFHNR